MHYALRLEEILLNIFGHLHPANTSWPSERRLAAIDLASLARTCRTFKEPALDILWSELTNLSPLAFCLPGRHLSSYDNRYLFTTPRTDAEWDTLRGYTRRVRSILGFASQKGSLDRYSISAVFVPALHDPLFPNLRSLTWQGGTPTLPVMHFAAAPLTSLDIRGTSGEDVSLYTNLLDTLVPRCPNIRNVRVQVVGNEAFNTTVSRHLLTWPMLCIVDLLDISLAIDVILHLLSIPTLTWLSFMLNSHDPSPVLAPNSATVFSQLVYLEIVSASLDAVTNLFANIRLPAVQTVIVPFPTRPSKATVKTYLAAMRKMCDRDTLTDLRVLHLASFAARFPGVASDHPTTPHDGDDRLVLTFDDMLPYMAFGNLRGVHVNLAWSVGLGDDELLALVSAWPQIEYLLINDQWGWRGAAGITLCGLAEVLKACPLLRALCIGLDARSAVAFCEQQHDEELKGLGVRFTLPSAFSQLNVADSVLEPDDTPVLTIALGALGITSRHLLAWSGSEMRDMPGADGFRAQWTTLFR